MIDTQQATEMVRQPLQRHGWSPVHGVAGTTHTGCFQRAAAQLFIDANAHWLCFVALLEANGQPLPELYGRALHLSDEWRLVKFSLDDRRQLLLQAEAPQVELQRRYCQQVAEAMALFHARTPELSATERSQPPKAQVQPAADLPSLRYQPRQEMTDTVSLRTLGQYTTVMEYEGWHLRDKLATNQWWLQWKSVERTFDCYLSFDHAWACFQMHLLTRDQVSFSRSALAEQDFYAYLLRLNDAIHWAKFGLDKEDQLLLSIDLPVDTFSLRTFRWATRTLAAYASEFFYEVQIMAGLGAEPRLSQLLARAKEHDHD